MFELRKNLKKQAGAWKERNTTDSKNGCNGNHNVSAVVPVLIVVQYTSHSLTRVSWVTDHTWTGDGGRSVL